MIKRKGLTLIELLVVIGIIALLLAIGVEGYRRMTISSQTRDSRQRLRVLAGLTTALRDKTTSTNEVFDSTFYVDPDRKIDWRWDASADAANSNELIARTIVVMNRLATIPENRKAIDNLPADRKLLPKSAQSRYLDPVTVPLVLDSWSNPLVYVPREGIINIRVTLPRQIISNIGVRPDKDGFCTVRMLSTGPLNNDVKLEDIPQSARGFWMSAGPDGLYDTGDDNLYSFEN